MPDTQCVQNVQEARASQSDQNAWSQWAVALVAALLVGGGLAVGAGVVPSPWAVEVRSLSIWAWMLIAAGGVLAGLLAATYTGNSAARKAGVLAVAALVGAIAALFGLLSGVQHWGHAAGLAPLQPLIGVVGVLALALAVVLAFRRTR